MTMPSSQPGLSQPAQGTAGLGPADRSDGSNSEDSRFDSLLRHYHTYLRGQRGLAENTVRNYLTDLACFQRYLCQEGLEWINMDRRMLRG